MKKRRTSYKKQLLTYFAGVFAVFAILLVVFQLRTERRYKSEILQSRLSGYADIMARTSDYAAVTDLLPQDLRITVIGRDGAVLFDSEADSTAMDNHLKRPEVRKSMEYSEGFSIRTSETTGMPYFYYAKSYGNYIVRVAMPYELDMQRFFRPDTLFLVLVFSLFTVALFSLIFISDHFGQGISKLRDFADAAVRGNVDYEGIEFPDSELGEIGEKMLESYRMLTHSNEMIALEKERLLLHIHLSETAKEQEDSFRLHKLSPTGYLESLGMLSPKVLAAHCVWMSEKDIELLALHDVKIVHNINSNLKLASGYKFKYKEFKDAGLTVTLGTDGCASSNNLDMLEAMKTAALVQKAWREDPTVMPLNELMDMATVNGAKALDLDCGSIEEGKLADMVLIDIDNYAFTPNYNFLANLIYSANSSCVDTVICNGDIVMENRHVNGEEEILENVRRIYGRLNI